MNCGRLTIWTLVISVWLLIALVGVDFLFWADTTARFNSTAYHVNHQMGYIRHFVDPSHPHTKEELKTKKPIKCCPGCYEVQFGPLVLPEGFEVPEQEWLKP